jgi:pimeloyl-[acyl-carrier protein] methyl ester esterase
LILLAIFQLDPTQGLKRFISLQTDNKTQLKSLKRSLDTLPASPNALAQGLAIFRQHWHFYHVQVNQ